MTYIDFIRTFTHLEVVHLDSETARDEPSMQGKTRWNMRFNLGAWQKGVTAGGCRNNSGNLRQNLRNISATTINYKILDTFHINPQLQLHVSQHDKVILSLSQHCVSEPQVSQIQL
jgi:calpain-9